jgi:hypothetical protein
MSAHYPVSDSPSEIYGSRTLYGAIVAGAAFLLIATVTSFGPSGPVATPESHATQTQAPTAVETVVVTAGQTK